MLIINNGDAPFVDDFRWSSIAWGHFNRFSMPKKLPVRAPDK